MCVSVFMRAYQSKKKTDWPGLQDISGHTNMQMNLIDTYTSIMAKNIELSKIKFTGFQFVFGEFDQKTLLNAFSFRRSHKTGNIELVRSNRNCTKC